jgi:hypothetical protein
MPTNSLREFDAPTLDSSLWSAKILQEKEIL